MQVKKILGLFVDDLKHISPNYKDKEPPLKIDILLKELDSVPYTHNKFAHILQSYLQMLRDEVEEEIKLTYVGNHQMCLISACKFISAHLRHIPSVQTLFNICYEIENKHAEDFGRPILFVNIFCKERGIRMLAKSQIKGQIKDIRKTKLLDIKEIRSEVKKTEEKQKHRKDCFLYLRNIIDRVTS